MKSAIFLIAILLLAGCAVKAEPGIPVTTYKSANCGCCGIWATYADQNGFDVDIKVLPSVDQKKEELGVSRELSSCHTSMIEGYVVEGHVPVEAINKLLTEKPDIKGIALPGMPSGTPGMPGPKTEDWIIYTIHHDGTQSEFMII